MTTESILLDEYLETVKLTDRMPNDELQPIQMGLFGEVGSLMTAAKKLRREQNAFPAFLDAVEEEFGDILWYMAALSRRCSCDFPRAFGDAASRDGYDERIAASDSTTGAVSRIASLQCSTELNQALIDLGTAAGKTLLRPADENAAQVMLGELADTYLRALHAAGLRFSSVVRRNIDKTVGRFVPVQNERLPRFDDSFPSEEQIPEVFEIHVTQRASGQCYLRWNGVFIGEPLTDNIVDADGYRFHDVFHFAYAAILNWSPVFRALIKQKRKSDPKVDEAQDGGRAIVVEEGISAWIFSRAKELDYFDGHPKVSFDLLKMIEQFVRGFEVQECPLNLWERAILDGYRVFRAVKELNGGIVVGDRRARTISFREG